MTGPEDLLRKSYDFFFQVCKFVRISVQKASSTVVWNLTFINAWQVVWISQFGDQMMPKAVLVNVQQFRGCSVNKQHTTDSCQALFLWHHKHHFPGQYLPLLRVKTRGLYLILNFPLLQHCDNSTIDCFTSTIWKLWHAKKLLSVKSRLGTRVGNRLIDIELYSTLTNQFPFRMEYWVNK